jgi:hypothetical protein
MNGVCAVMKEGEPASLEGLHGLFGEIYKHKNEAPAAVTEGLAALDRLAPVALARGGQGERVLRFLIGCYSGSTLALELPLGGLDWQVRKDLCAVLLGCGERGFPDTKIRDAFAAREARGWFIDRVIEMTNVPLEAGM